MTQPTQAQIEAVNEEYWKKAYDIVGDLYHHISHRPDYTAAAQVGEPEDAIDYMLRKSATNTNATIERCAQVAENFNAAGKPIAAAIRRLKDAP